MNRENIIRMAREAGFEEVYDSFVCDPEDIERFAALVAAAAQEKMMDRIRNIIVEAEERGAAAEREKILKELQHAKSNETNL